MAMEDEQAIAFVTRHFRDEYRPLLSSSALRAMTLFNVDSTGRLSVLLPGDEVLEGTIFWFPDPSHGERLRLEGFVGTETVVAIATQQSAGFRERVYLDPARREHAFTNEHALTLLDRVFTVVASLPKDSWAIGRFEFELIE